MIDATTTVSVTGGRPYLLQLRMGHELVRDMLVLLPRPEDPRSVVAQFEAAVAAIVAQAVEEDRAKWGRGEAAAVAPPEPADGRLDGEPSVMPSFPMAKRGDFDRLVLLREPREPGSAFAQFERALEGYLERHPVYEDRERVVHRDRPCPVCPCPRCAEKRDDGWEADDEEGPQPSEEQPTACTCCHGRAIVIDHKGFRSVLPCPACGNQTDPARESNAEVESPRCRPDGPPPAPSFRARLRAALAARLGDGADELAANGLAALVEEGDPDAIRVAFEVLGDGEVTP